MNNKLEAKTGVSKALKKLSFARHLKAAAIKVQVTMLTVACKSFIHQQIAS